MYVTSLPGSLFHVTKGVGMHSWHSPSRPHTVTGPEKGPDHTSANLHVSSCSSDGNVELMTAPALASPTRTARTKPIHAQNRE